MPDFTEVNLKKMAVHFVGNSLQEEGMKLSKKVFEPKDGIITDILKKYFLSHFKGELFYNFSHESDLQLNDLYNICSALFNDPDSLFLQSVKVSEKLYSASNHHLIKGGDFYTVYFENIILQGETTDAIGFFKSENKETYMKVFHCDDCVEIESDEGININKLDKGCLVFNLDKEKGFRLCIVDNNNKSQEAYYWKNNFLNVKPHQNSFFHTENYLHLCKDFCKDVLEEQFDVNKADQIEILNRSVNYFSKKDTFNIREFEEEVMTQPEIIDAFQDYKEEYSKRFDVPAFDEFDISHNAVKYNKKFFRSVIKLDKNFHVYVHGNRDYIEKGYDEERGMNYYRLFFMNEK
jgi:hypothetical protein